MQLLTRSNVPKKSGIHSFAVRQWGLLVCMRSYSAVVVHNVQWKNILRGFCLISSPTCAYVNVCWLVWACSSMMPKLSGQFNTTKSFNDYHDSLQLESHISVSFPTNDGRKKKPIMKYRQIGLLMEPADLNVDPITLLHRVTNSCQISK